MNAYLIDPVRRRIQSIDYHGSPEQLSQRVLAEEFISTPINEEGDIVLVARPDAVPEPVGYFVFGRKPVVFSGKGVVVGLNPNTGNVRAPAVALHKLKELVLFGRPVVKAHQLKFKGAKLTSLDY